MPNGLLRSFAPVAYVEGVLTRKEVTYRGLGNRQLACLRSYPAHFRPFLGLEPGVEGIADLEIARG